jgi:hypothetical protein
VAAKAHLRSEPVSRFSADSCVRAAPSASSTRSAIASTRGPPARFAAEMSSPYTWVGLPHA